MSLKELRLPMLKTLATLNGYKIDGEEVSETLLESLYGETADQIINLLVTDILKELPKKHAYSHEGEDVYLKGYERGYTNGNHATLDAVRTKLLAYKGAE